MSATKSHLAKSKKNDDLCEVEEDQTFEFPAETSEEVAVTKPGVLAQSRRSRSATQRATSSPDDEHFDIE